MANYSSTLNMSDEFQSFMHQFDGTEYNIYSQIQFELSGGLQEFLNYKKFELKRFKL